MLVHGVETAIFDHATGMQMIKQEIETFNQNIKLARDPQWLVKPENRIEKIHSSVKISVRSQAEFDQARKGLVIAGKMPKTLEFQSLRPTNQCHKCLKYGHISIQCKQPVFSCK